MVPAGVGVGGKGERHRSPRLAYFVFHKIADWISILPDCSKIILAEYRKFVHSRHTPTQQRQTSGNGVNRNGKSMHSRLCVSQIFSI
jgi:hypothetical protein